MTVPSGYDANKTSQFFASNLNASKGPSNGGRSRSSFGKCAMCPLLLRLERTRSLWPIARDQRQKLFDGSAGERLDHNTHRVRQLSHLHALAGSSLDVAKRLPVALRPGIAPNHAKTQPFRSVTPRPTFDSLVECLGIARPMASSSDDEQANVPHVLREKIGDDIRHCDKRTGFIYVADKPLPGEAPPRRQFTVDRFVRLLRAGRLTIRSDKVLRILLEEALQERLILGRKLDRAEGRHRRRWKLCS